MPLVSGLSRGKISYTNTLTSDAYGTTVDTLTETEIAFAFGDGVAANQADRAYRYLINLTDTSATLTLSALPGSQGFIKARAMAIKVLTGGTLAVAPGDTNPWPGVTIGRPLVAGSGLIVSWPATAGASVASGSADKIKFTAVGTVTGIAVFLGTSA